MDEKIQQLVNYAVDELWHPPGGEAGKVEAVKEFANGLKQTKTEDARKEVFLNFLKNYSGLSEALQTALRGTVFQGSIGAPLIVDQLIFQTGMHCLNKEIRQAVNTGSPQTTLGEGLKLSGLFFGMWFISFLLAFVVKAIIALGGEAGLAMMSAVALIPALSELLRN